ncbi:putative Cyclin-like superfamily [Helianthus annuus]|nr:putative Cyclin-like superfamily [Helianthus annuus]KAJ0562441.1 putative Cyclin-like superfamily [Helianthus annuus]KAJ0727816.1 putative Cyclin-like superfamily [Helianthus annuus]
MLIWSIFHQFGQSDPRFYIHSIFVIFFALFQLGFLGVFLLCFLHSIIFCFFFVDVSYIAYSIATIFSYATGNNVIFWLIDKYGINDVNDATKYYEIAVERGFTRGRRTTQVAVACLYVVCRPLWMAVLLDRLQLLLRTHIEGH